jgi:hypothetical protein
VCGQREIVFLTSNIGNISFFSAYVAKSGDTGAFATIKGEREDAERREREVSIRFIEAHRDNQRIAETAYYCEM